MTRRPPKPPRQAPVPLGHRHAKPRGRWEAGEDPAEARERIEMRRAEAVGDAVLPHLLTFVDRLLHRYPACRFSTARVFETAGKLALMSLLDLPPRVGDVLSNEELEAIAYRVGVTVAFDMVDADLIRQRLPPARRLDFES